MMYLYASLLTIFSFLIGAQFSFIMTKRTVRRKLNARAEKLDGLNLYSMIWYRGYRTALVWADHNLFDDEDIQDDNFVI